MTQAYISVALIVMAHNPNASGPLVQACNSTASRHWPTLAGFHGMAGFDSVSHRREGGRIRCCVVWSYTLGA